MTTQFHIKSVFTPAFVWLIYFTSLPVAFGQTSNRELPKDEDLVILKKNGAVTILNNDQDKDKDKNKEKSKEKD